MKSKAKVNSSKSTVSNLSHLLGMEIFICVIFCFIFVILFLKISEDVFHNEILTFDTNAMNYLYSLRSPTLNNLMLGITFFGSAFFLFCASSLTALYLFTKRKKDSFIFISIIYTAVILNIVLKFLFSRPRPDLMPLVHESSFSYPSAHAMNSFVFYTAIAYFIFRVTKNVKIGIVISSLFAFLIFFIGLSRVYLGAHYPSDVLAGYVAGFIWIIVAIIFEKAIIFERLKKSKVKRK